jgi:hypothetical protein
LSIDWTNPGWLLQTFIGAFVGVLFGVPISWRFARMKSQELRDAAAELRAENAEQRRLQMLAMRAQEGGEVIPSPKTKPGLLWE